MNKEKIGNLLRVIAVILIATVALFLIGATAADKTPQDNNTPQDDETPDNSQTDDTTPDQDTTDNNDSAKPDDEEVKVYKSPLTGLDVTEEEYLAHRLALIYSPTDTLYGISLADIVVEIPVSDESTRYVVYTSFGKDLSKIGTLAPVRDNMLALFNSFGGVFVAKGNDGVVEYKHPQQLHIDLSQGRDYSFNESVNSTYTSGELLLDYMRDKGTVTVGADTPTPFLFSDDDFIGRAVCNVITLPYSDKSTTSLVYDKSIFAYTLLSSGKAQVDMLTGINASFTNAFVLFSDSVTYERSDLIETVTETLCGGAGYYLSLGRLTEIKWEADADGIISFKTLSGDELKINRGKTYIGYFKSSERNSVKFE